MIDKKAKKRKESARNLPETCPLLKVLLNRPSAVTVTVLELITALTPKTLVSSATKEDPKAWYSELMQSPVVRPVG